MTDATQALATMRSMASRGEVAGDWNNVVNAYKTAGQHGASVVGPAIDELSGGNSQTTTITHRAWSNNGLLAALNSSPSATKEDADAAKRFVDTMIQDLQTALNIAKAHPHPMAAMAAAAHYIANNPTAGRPSPQYQAPVYSPPYTPPVYTSPTPAPDHEHDDMRDVKRFGPVVVGAAIGLSVGGPVGAGIGALLGLGVGIVISENRS